MDNQVLFNVLVTLALIYLVTLQMKKRYHYPYVSSKNSPYWRAYGRYRPYANYGHYGHYPRHYLMA